MTTDEYAFIYQWHPEMILISETPVTWKGFLIVSCKSNIKQTTRVKLKLSAPNYPSLSGAELNFGKEVYILRNKQFYERVNNLLQTALTIPSFLRQLQFIISEFIDESHTKLLGIHRNVTADIIQELQDTLQSSSEVQLSSNKTLNIIKLSKENISVTLQRNDYDKIPWKVTSSDFPEVKGIDPFEENLVNLNFAKKKFQTYIKIFEEGWTHLCEIDKNCWVIDPLQPKPYHLYRRIYLTESLSILITIDPLNPSDLPDIKLLGSDVEMEKKRNIISNNIHDWCLEHTIIHNLKMLLDVAEFPQNLEQNAIKETGVIVADEECCICFSLELETEHLPNKICNNAKCKRRFHTVCLLQWLQAVAGNQVVFDHIHGSCPHCGENISCTVK